MEVEGEVKGGGEVGMLIPHLISWESSINSSALYF